MTDLMNPELQVQVHSQDHLCQSRAWALYLTCQPSRDIMLLILPLCTGHWQSLLAHDCLRPTQALLGPLPTRPAPEYPRQTRGTCISPTTLSTTLTLVRQLVYSSPSSFVC